MYYIQLHQFLYEMGLPLGQGEDPGQLWATLKNEPIEVHYSDEPNRYLNGEILSRAYLKFKGGKDGT